MMINMTKQIRARTLGIKLNGTSGSFNSITDVKGVEVGHSTIIEGDGDLRVGKGSIRTGVTVILPKGFYQKEHDFEAIDSASSGYVQEGNVGGGTGMMLFAISLKVGLVQVQE